LITNISFGNSNKLSIGVIDKFLFGGKYDDINPEWYLNVGTVLVYIYINIILLALNYTYQHSNNTSNDDNDIDGRIIEIIDW